jgi:hypothetical protein
MYRLFTTAAIVATLAIAPATLRAQQATVGASAATYGHLAGLRRSMRSESPALVTAPMAASGSRRQGTILMIVGAAGIVTGLIVDEPIVTIAGAGVAGLGLYLYLEHGGEVRVGGQRSLPAL